MMIYFTKNGQQLGPYTLAEVQSLVAAGTVTINDLAWHDGLATWIPLYQVAGFSAPPGAGAVVRRRPVLVWIICIFYFFSCGIGVFVIPFVPRLLTFTHLAMQKAEDSLNSSINSSANPGARAGLLRARDQMAASDEIFSKIAGPFYVVQGETMTILCLAFATCLFLLRRVALYLFATTLVLGLGYQIYVYCFSGLLQLLARYPTQLAPSLFGLVFGWALNFLILGYVWSLYRKGVLR